MIQIRQAQIVRVGCWIIGLVCYSQSVEGVQRWGDILQVFFLYVGSALILDTIYTSIMREMWDL